MTSSTTPPTTAATDGIHVTDLTVGYDEVDVLHDLDLVVPPGRITAIVGANACGKSTLLHTLARLLRPRGGTVVLDGDDVHRLPTRKIATRLGLLPQAPIAPEGITVVDLVARGRYPHQSWVRQWTAEHEDAVVRAMVATGTLELATRPVDQLSGGQRQRVWIALAIAQDTPVMLLDEPTTYLDVTHQLEVLDILADLNQRDGRTVVMVLHDLGHAARYAHHLVAMREGRIVATGTPAEVVTEQTVGEVFGLRARVLPDPVSGAPMVLPIGRHLNLADPSAIPPPPGSSPPPPGSAPSGPDDR